MYLHEIPKPYQNWIKSVRGSVVESNHWKNVTGGSLKIQTTNLLAVSCGPEQNRSQASREEKNSFNNAFVSRGLRKYFL